MKPCFVEIFIYGLTKDKKEEDKEKEEKEKKRTYRKNVYKSHNQKKQKKILSI